jgi:hypothetical protein
MTKPGAQAYFPTQAELMAEIELRRPFYEDRPEIEVLAWKVGFAAGARWVAERSKLPDPPDSVRLPRKRAEEN